MNLFELKKKKEKSQNGFTLIELMVAVAIFSIVLVVAMGAILTILDANRKARTLTEVMNNLNFSLESVTRSIKTGVEPTYDTGENILSVTSIDLDAGNFSREIIEYRRNTTTEGRGYLERRVGGTGNWSPITSEVIDIKRFEVTVAGTADFNQPRTQLTIQGEVSINEKIASDFTIQTTVSQRKLNLEGSEAN